jgi:ATP-binding cassette, subfamily B, bacterial IrtB/YbtQ
MKLSGEYRRKLNRAYVLSFFENLLADVPVFLIFYVLAEIIRGGFTVRTILISSTVLVCGVVLRMILRYLVDANQSGVGYEIFARERMSLGDRIKRFPMGFFTEGNVGNVTAVITNDISFVEEYGMDTLGKITSSLLALAVTLLFLLCLDWRLGTAFFAVCSLFMLIFVRLNRIAAEESEKQQEVQKELSGTVIEYIKGMPVVKAFNLEGRNHRATSEAFSRMTETQLRYEQRFCLPMILSETAAGLGVAVCILVSGLLGFSGTLQLPFIIGMIVFSFQLVGPLLILSGITAQIRVADAALDRYDALHHSIVIDDGGKDIALPRFDIEFSSVRFGYEKNDILKDVSFTVPEHSMTALVGKSGCGKSTIVNLLARFWDVRSGSIKIGGVDVRELTSESLLKNISVVFQNVYLFNDTVFNNVAFGKPCAVRSEVEEACKKARCHDFIMALENGYDTVIGEGGSTLSGGEKQRISIARAILKDAPVVLLDEATASIDPDNEAYIQQAINEMVKGKTLIVIAHKLSSVVNADQILVIEDGTVTERGTHNQLLTEGGLYAALWERGSKSRGWKIAGDKKF